MALFERFLGPKKKPAAPGPAEDPKWSRSEKGHFRRLMTLDPEEEGLTGKSGVFVVWHGGARSGWVFAGASADLAQAFHGVGEDEKFSAYEEKGGLFVTWAAIREEFQAGVVKYLNETMNPLVENPEVSKTEDEPIPVILPGRENKV